MSVFNKTVNLDSLDLTRLVRSWRPQLWLCIVNLVVEHVPDSLRRNQLLLRVICLISLVWGLWVSLLNKLYSFLSVLFFIGCLRYVDRFGWLTTHVDFVRIDDSWLRLDGLFVWRLGGRPFCSFGLGGRLFSRLRGWFWVWAWWLI